MRDINRTVNILSSTNTSGKKVKSVFIKEDPFSY